MKPGRVILAFSGPSGSGKTTLLVKLIPALLARGLTVAALKRSGHRHAFDRRGKDSARLRAAGAVAVAIQGPAGLAWFGPPRPGGIAELARLLPPVDLVLAEGFKEEAVPRVEVHRSAVDPAFRCLHDPWTVAVVSDVPPPCDLPWFTPRQLDALTEYVTRWARDGRARKRALASSRTRAHRVPGEAEPRERIMARTTKASTSRRSGRTRSGRTTRGRRTTGGATVREAGRKGGRRTLERRGPEFYSRIGRKGGKSSGHARRNAARSRRGGGTRGTRGTRSGAGARRKSSRR